MIYQHVVSSKSRLRFVDGSVVQNKSASETVHGKETISCQSLADFHFVARNSTHF
jgi:hypothetical protein